MSETREEEQRFAFFEWPKRWNNTAGAIAHLTEVDHVIFATCGMGVVKIRPEDVPHFVRQMRGFLDSLERFASEPETTR
jgi:hypothetical protein